MRTLRRIAKALEDRNNHAAQTALLQLRLGSAQNEVLLRISKTLGEYLTDLREMRESNKEKSAVAQEGAEEMVARLLKQLGDQPTRITINGAPAPQLATPRRTGLVVGGTVVEPSE